MQKQFFEMNVKYGNILFTDKRHTQVKKKLNQKKHLFATFFYYIFKEHSILFLL